MNLNRKDVRMTNEEIFRLAELHANSVQNGEIFTIHIENIRCMVNAVINKTYREIAASAIKEVSITDVRNFLDSVLKRDQ